MANNNFSQRHPFIFGFALIAAALFLILGLMAAFSFWGGFKDILSFGQSKLGLVKIEGTILESRKINAWIEKLANNKDIQGVIVRINSPGGIVAPSQEIYQQVNKLAQKKPVIVSMGSVAASGGYYIACAGDQIIANPGTLTGSIGVKANLMNIHKLLDRLGIKDQTIASGKFKTAGNPAQKMTPEEKSYFQNLVDNMLNQFIQAVAKGRALSIDEVKKLADGRAFTGQQALEAKLVDKLGGLQTAVEILKLKCKIKGKYKLVEGPEKETSLLKWILGQLPWQGTADLKNQQFLFMY
jgi:protease-4